MGELHSNEQEIFERARKMSSPDERELYLRCVCRNDVRLEERVLTLLRAYDDSPDFLEVPPPELCLSSTPEGYALPRVGGTIGRYQILQKIGEGGFGVVYMAEQEQPVLRRVALKLIKPGMDSRAVIARFEAERQALAMMNHPHIATVLDAGESDLGLPYFVMELVNGIRITRFCDEHDLPVEARLRLFIDVCRAVQHAHQKGIIHRDIKPGNVLVTQLDGRPVVKVIDFGVAKAIGQKLTDKTLLTQFALMIGTPTYMSPEQAEMSGADVDTRSDIYSLGVLLYELLTGTTPYDAQKLCDAGFDELRRIIREEDPPKPSFRVNSQSKTLSTAADHRCVEARRLSTLLRGELDWIVMTALEKDRARRYATVSELAHDVERYLNQEPIEASPPSATYRLRKYLRRNRVILATATTVITALMLATIVSTTQAYRARRAEQLANSRYKSEGKALQRAELQEGLARREQELTRENLYFANLRLAQQDWKSGHLSRMIEKLDAHLPTGHERDLRGWEWFYLASLARRNDNVLAPQLGPIRNTKWHPQGVLLAIAGTSGGQVYNMQTGQIVYSWIGLSNIAWSPAGDKLAIVVRSNPFHSVRIVSTDDWVEQNVHAISNTIYGFAWRPDGEALAFDAGPNQIAVWELEQKVPTTHTLNLTPPLDIRAMTWNPTEETIVMGGAFPERLIYWDVRQKKVSDEVLLDRRGISCTAYSPDGTKLATGGFDGGITIWDATNHTPIRSFPAHRGYVFRCDWSEDGNQLLSSGEDNIVHLWDAQTGRLTRRFPGHRSNVRTVDWRPDSYEFVSGGSEGDVRFWQAGLEPDLVEVPGQHTLAISPDSRQLVTGHFDAAENYEYIIVDIQTGHVVRSLEARHGWTIHAFAWSPDGTRIAGDGSDRKLRVWDAETGRQIYSRDSHQPETRCVAWSPDGRLLATCGMDRLVKIWQADNGELLQTFSDHETMLGSVAWSPDGRWLASADWRRDIKIRSTESWEIEWEIDLRPALVGAGAGGCATIAWNPNSNRLVAVDSSGDLVLLNLQSGRTPEVVWSVNAHTSNLRTVAWSPDGARIASCSEDQSVKVWHAESGRELLTLGGFESLVYAVVWSPDGRRLTAANGRNTVRIWDATAAFEKQTIAAESQASSTDPAPSPSNPRHAAATENAPGPARESRPVFKTVGAQ